MYSVVRFYLGHFLSDSLNSSGELYDLIILGE